MKRIYLIGAFLIGITFGLIIRFDFPAYLFASTDTLYKQAELFTEALLVIRDNYVKEVSTKELIENAIKGMVAKLDPFSSFLLPDESKIMDSEAKGEFGGLGIKIAIRDEILTVITPLPGTPAMKAGILPGDKIIKIEGESTKGITLMEAVKKLRGKPGTKVKITILRNGEEPFDVEITRAIIKIESVPPYKAKILEDDIGYIKITEFNKHTPEDFEKVYKKLEEKGMKALILDLRNNPGGLLSSAVEICKELLPPNKLIVYTKGRGLREERKFYSDSKWRHELIPLVVLINRGSASGSEIVAGAIKDWKRGVLVGEKTFGKASVQSIIPLKEGYSLRLTVAHYYTPKGNLIHEKGIEPDIKVEIPKEEWVKLIQQEEEIFGLSEEEKKKREKEKIPDRQLQVALNLLKAQEIFSSKD